MTSNSDNTFFQTYFDYVGETESPWTYHRWSIVTAVAASLGRQTYVPFGHFTMYPNLYTLLMGESGARKTGAITIASKLLAKSGYTRFAPNKCSKEQFLKSMTEQDIPLGPDGQELDLEELLDRPLKPCNELFVDADEFPDFIGVGNTEFTTMLTTLWDGKDKYLHPKLNSADVEVLDPMVNILGGATQEGFSMAFPPEIMGQGFASRLLFIYSDPSGVQITWPKAPCPELGKDLTEYLRAIRAEIKGPMSIADDAAEALDKCYKQFPPMGDKRFLPYSSRRFSMLLKLATTLAAMDLSRVITLPHALQANTMLHYAECRMPKALGEYGKSRNASQQALVLDILDRANGPLDLTQLWRQLSTDLTRQTDLVEIMKNLSLAEKIKVVQTKAGGAAFVRLHKIRESWSDSLILPDFLKLEEME